MEKNIINDNTLNIEDSTYSEKNTWSCPYYIYEINDEFYNEDYEKNEKDLKLKKQKIYY
jgi:hypothetical protein